MTLAQPSTTVGAQNNIPPIINDFCITFSTINGSGSATSNTTLLRALFKMGIPVSGKNIFPSNIQGQPTWYSLRVSKDGFLGRLDRDDIIVAMNPDTIYNEQTFLVPGGVLIYNDSLVLPETRQDITIYPMPVKALVKEAEIPPRLKDYIANMVYVGVVSQVLGIDLDLVRQALDFQFKGKQEAVDINFQMVALAAEWARLHIKKTDPYRVEPMQETTHCILADGNTAAALGAIYGGVQFAAWYPITPATSLAESLNEYLPMLRKDPQSGKNTFAVIQAEDEIAAIGMAIGAGWAGLRAMTSTSGPGLSLMAEYLGLAYFTETPVVVWDVQRVGPSTGLPTRTAQGDLTFANNISHGDTQFVLLIPGSVHECFEFGWRAFDIANRLQTPVIVMSDLDLGMNQWMSPPFEYPSEPIDFGKVVWEEELDALIEKVGGEWGRYLDVDGDGIPYRTLPGNRNPRAAYFARGTGHNEYGRYSEHPQDWMRLMDRLKKKFQTARNMLPKPIITTMENASVGIIGCGSTDFSIREARRLLSRKGIPTNYMRVRALPFNNEVVHFIEKHDRNYVVELNRDGQLEQLLSLEVPHLATHFEQVSRLDGMPLAANWVADTIIAREEALQ